jgi:general secretion pathway protein G
MTKAVPERPGGSRRSARAFTLIELLIVMAIMGILAALAIPKLEGAVEKARIARAIGDIKAIGRNLQEYEISNNDYPSSLGALNMGAIEDPWGNAYEYLKLKDVKGNGKKRKDRFLVPINSDFDLYSMGPDGKSASPLTASSSRDDIIWANDGGFVGVAIEY